MLLWLGLGAGAGNEIDDLAGSPSTMTGNFSYSRYVFLEGLGFRGLGLRSQCFFFERLFPPACRGISLCLGLRV